MFGGRGGWQLQARVYAPSLRIAGGLLCGAVALSRMFPESFEQPVSKPRASRTAAPVTARDCYHCGTLLMSIVKPSHEPAAMATIRVYGCASVIRNERRKQPERFGVSNAMQQVAQLL